MEPMTGEELAEVFAELQKARRLEWPRLTEIRRYLQNRAVETHEGKASAEDIYVPKEATVEYRMLVDQARFNITPLVVTAVAQNLFVDGYRPTSASGRPERTDADLWRKVWQPNRMDAQQGGLFRASIAYGASYMSVLPAAFGPGDHPVLKPWSPLRMTTIYSDHCDEWPEYALSTELPDDLTARRIELSHEFGPVKIKIYDSHFVYETTLGAPDTVGLTEPIITEHGLGVTPVVRFPDKYDLDGDNFGKVWPILPVQRQINQTTFGLLMAQQYGAFRQRWATGMAIEIDADGNPKEPWNSAINTVWQNESPDGKFGDFAETSLAGYLEARDKALLHVASVAQIPPHNLLVGSGISNISAEALAAIESGHRRDIIEHQHVYGEAVEQVLRLAGLAMGDLAAWEDRSAQVVWQDTTPRSFAQIADALGKLALSLQIPVQALWERIPGVTDEDLARWIAMASEQSTIDEIEAMLKAEMAAAQPDPEEDDEPKEEEEGELAPVGGSNGSNPGSPA